MVHFTVKTSNKYRVIGLFWIIFQGVFMFLLFLIPLTRRLSAAAGTRNRLSGIKHGTTC